MTICTQEKIRIENLADHREHIPIVARWLWEEWSDGDGTSVDDIENRTKRFLERQKVPMTFVALSGIEPVGTFSLWTNDLNERPDLAPWLAAVFVIPSKRGKGIGTLMQRHALQQAKLLGYGSLYLITNHVGYYEKAGWTFIGEAVGPDEKLKRIYEHTLNP